MKPALRLGESLVLAQMYGDHQWDVKEQFPVIVGIRPVFGDIDLLREVFDMNKIIFIRVVEVFEKVLS